MNPFYPDNFSFSPAHAWACLVSALLSDDWLVTLTSAHHQSLPPPGTPGFFFFLPSLLISLSRASTMMDITVGMFFISSGAGNGLGPPPHSGIETKSNIKNVLGAKLQRQRAWATDRLAAVRVVMHQGTMTSVKKDVYQHLLWRNCFSALKSEASGCFIAH